MRGQKRLGRLGGALAVSVALAGGAGAPAVAATQTPIQHVIVLFQENESFDHYFGTYPNAKFPNEATGGEQYGQSFTALSATPTVNGYNSELLNDNPNLNHAGTALVSPVRLAPNQAYTCSNSHAYLAEQEAVDKGLMDMFPKYTAATGGEGCLTDGSTVLAYFDGNTVTALWNYAQHYAMSDNSFGSTFGPSTPGVVNLVSGQTLGGILHHAGSSSGNVYVNTNSTTAGSGLPETVTNVTDIGDEDAYLDDCGNDKGGTVVSATLQMTSKNIGDLLNAQGIIWGWFQGGFAPTIAAALNSDGTTSTPAVCGATHIEHLYPNTGTPIYSLTNQIGSPIGGNVQTSTADYVSHHAGFMFYASTRNSHHLAPTPGATIGGPDLPNLPGCAPSACTGANHNYDASVLFTALSNGTLPAVTFVKAPAYQNAHPGNSDPLLEQTWLVQVINAVVSSSAWPTTAIIIAYDDSDGWYDHVSAPVVNQSNTNEDALAGTGSCGTALTATLEGRCGHAFRQPLLVISPWAKSNYVDHTLTNQASIIAFIEYNWNLGTIGTIDGSTSPQTPGSASFDQSAGSLLGLFNFTGAPNLKHLILNPTGTVESDS